MSTFALPFIAPIHSFYFYSSCKPYFPRQKKPVLDGMLICFQPSHWLKPNLLCSDWSEILLAPRGNYSVLIGSTVCTILDGSTHFHLFFPYLIAFLSLAVHFAK